MSTDNRNAATRRVWGGFLGLIIAMLCFSPVWAMGSPEESAPYNRVFIPVVSSASSAAVAPGPQPAWLVSLNRYRTIAGLPPLSENAAWSLGDSYHSRYMVKNNLMSHTEDPSKPWYTSEGATAARNSNIMASSDVGMSDTAALDLWMKGPFHGVALLDPELKQVGFGSYRENLPGFRMGAALDVLQGSGAIPSSVTFPVFWPGKGSTVNLASFNGGESPNPLTSCNNYPSATGLPVILQIGPGDKTPSVTAHSFKQGSTALDHCIFDQTSYTNPNSGEQSLGRGILDSRDAIVLIPRSPLTPGQTYTVSITANGQTYSWSFTVGAAN